MGVADSRNDWVEPTSNVLNGISKLACTEPSENSCIWAGKAVSACRATVSGGVLNVRYSGVVPQSPAMALESLRVASSLADLKWVSLDGRAMEES